MRDTINYCKELFPQLSFVSDEILRETNEIRVRVNFPIILYGNFGMYALSSKEIISNIKMQEIFKKLCDFSVYSRENEIKNGFITVNGGNRVGVCGTAVVKNGEISGIRNISSLNFRVAREYIGCAEKFEGILKSGGVLLAGPSGCGKTTFLRDAARILSKSGKKVAIIDERGEIAGVNEGYSSFDIGSCDILNAFPKKEGILYALRTLASQYIICDEVGMASEAESITECMHAGAYVTASVHLEKIEDIFRRKSSASLLMTGAFSSVIFIRNFKAKSFTAEELHEAYGNNFSGSGGGFCGINKSSVVDTPRGTT